MSDLTGPTIPSDRDLTEKPADEELADKPSLAAAIEKGREICRSLEQLEHLPGGLVIDAKEGAPVLRRLVEAAELWLRFGTLSEDFIKTLDGEKDRQIQALRRQLDALGKERDRRIKSLERKLTDESDHVSSKMRTIEDLRSQLAKLEGIATDRRQTIKAMEITRDHKLDEDEEIKDLRPQLAELEEALKEKGGVWVPADKWLKFEAHENAELRQQVEELDRAVDSRGLTIKVLHSELEEKEEELKALRNVKVVCEETIGELAEKLSRKELANILEQKEQELEHLRKELQTQEIGKIRIPPSGEELCNLGSILNDLVIALLKDAYQDPDTDPTKVVQERLDVHWKELQRLNRIGFPGRLGIVEKKLELLADKNPGCFDDTGQPTVVSAPTEAEVDKVAQALRKSHFGWAPEVSAAADWDKLDESCKESWRRPARDVIERGYRREE